VSGATGGCQSQMMGAGAQWWPSKLSGGRRSQVVGVGGKW